jgi:hypothetical protein
VQAPAFHLEMQATDTIHQVKGLIQQSQGVEVRRQRLFITPVFRELGDYQTLANSGVADNAVLTLVLGTLTIPPLAPPSPDAVGRPCCGR